MGTLGKALFWIGFIILMGVVVAYLIIMFAGTLAYLTTTTVLSICALIFIGALVMLMGRAYERRSERKRLNEINTNK